MSGTTTGRLDDVTAMGAGGGEERRDYDVRTLADRRRQIKSNARVPVQQPELVHTCETEWKPTGNPRV